VDEKLRVVSVDGDARAQPRCQIGSELSDVRGKLHVDLIAGVQILLIDLRGRQRRAGHRCKCKIIINMKNRVNLELIVLESDLKNTTHNNTKIGELL